MESLSCVTQAQKKMKALIDVLDASSTKKFDLKKFLAAAGLAPKSNIKQDPTQHTHTQPNVVAVVVCALGTQASFCRTR